MIRLVLAEMNRLRSRRFALIAVIAVAVALGLFQLAAYQAVKQPSAAEIAEAQTYYQQAKQDYEQNKADYEKSEQDCIDQGNPPDACHYEPSLSDYMRTPETFFSIGSTGLLMSVLLAGLTMLFVGGSFIGGEYSSGSLSNWLSFIPERGKVFFSKIIGLAIPAALVSAVASGLTLACTAILVATQDGAHHQLGDLIAMAARGIPLVVLLAALGFCISLATRHTVGAVGVILGYLFVAFIRNALSYGIPALQELPPWLPESNLLAFLNHGGTYETQVQHRLDDGSITYDYVTHSISFTHSAIYLAVVLVVAVGGAFLIFRRRDVN